MAQYTVSEAEPGKSYFNVTLIDSDGNNVKVIAFNNTWKPEELERLAVVTGDVTPNTKYPTGRPILNKPKEGKSFKGKGEMSDTEIRASALQSAATIFTGNSEGFDTDGTLVTFGDNFKTIVQECEYYIRKGEWK